MNNITPFTTFLDRSDGDFLPLPELLDNLYGSLRFPVQNTDSYVISNFVTTIDGVVTLNVSGHAGGGDISGFNRHDQLLMGTLRAAADAVVAGTSQLKSPPGTIWTPKQINPQMAEVYDAFRGSMKKPGQPLQVIVTATGLVDVSLPIFQSGEAPVLILTNAQAADRLRDQKLPVSVKITSLEATGRLTARSIIEAVDQALGGSGKLILIEGGPHMMRYFFEEKCLDELFLTVAPQVAGRDPTIDRPSFVAGKMFAPQESIWGSLVSLKQAGNHLFLRYRFNPGSQRD
jgi:riboflavin biosynthesis pyrimidine reductase